VHCENKCRRENSISFFQHIALFIIPVDNIFRTGIADGGEFYIRPPGTAVWLFDKVKY